jgi:hypothetical protein
MAPGIDAVQAQGRQSLGLNDAGYIKGKAGSVV